MNKNPFPTDLNTQKPAFFPFTPEKDPLNVPGRLSEDNRTSSPEYKQSSYGTALQASKADTLQQAHDLILIGLDDEWENSGFDDPYIFTQHKRRVEQPHFSLYEKHGPLVVETNVLLRLFNCRVENMELKSGACVELHNCDLTALSWIQGSTYNTLKIVGCEATEWEILGFIEGRIDIYDTNVELLRIKQGIQTDTIIEKRLLRQRDFYTENTDSSLMLRNLDTRQERGDFITKNTACHFVLEATINEGVGRQFNYFAHNQQSNISIEDSEFYLQKWVVLGDTECDLFHVNSIIGIPGRDPMCGFNHSKGTQTALQSDHVTMDCLFTGDNSQIGVTDCNAISFRVAPLHNSSIQFTDGLMTASLAIMEGINSNIIRQGGTTTAIADSIIIGSGNYGHLRDTKITAPVSVAKGKNSNIKVRSSSIETGVDNFLLETSGVILEDVLATAGANTVKGVTMDHVLAAKSVITAGASNFDLTDVDWFEFHDGEAVAGASNLSSVGFGNGHITKAVLAAGAPSITVFGNGLADLRMLKTVCTKEIILDGMERVFFGNIEALFLEYIRSNVHSHHSKYLLYINGEGVSHMFDNIVEDHVILEGHHDIRTLLNLNFLNVSGNGHLLDTQPLDLIEALGNWAIKDILIPPILKLTGTGQLHNVLPPDLIDVIGTVTGELVQTTLMTVKGDARLTHSPIKTLQVEGNAATFESVTDLIDVQGVLEATRCIPATIKVVGNLSVVESNPGIIDVHGVAASENSNPGSFLVNGCVDGAHSSPGVFQIKGSGALHESTNIDWEGAGAISESVALKFIGASNGYNSAINFLEGAGSLHNITGAMSDGVYTAKDCSVGPYLVAKYELGGGLEFIHLDYPEVRIKGALTFGSH